jgi:hypothetical protein
MDMNSATHDHVRQRCFKAFLLGFQFAATPVLDFKEGQYVLRDGQFLHPLEYFLLIDDGPFAGDWLVDLQRVLGVSTPWVGGFVQGFAGEAALGDGDDYLAGFRCGLAIVEDYKRLKDAGQ